MSSFCLKCKSRTGTTNPHNIVYKNGSNAEVGNCAVCDMKKSTIIKRGGDIQSALGKLPGLPWSKYSGEKHLPGHNYCGPGTRLDIRLDSDDKPTKGNAPTSRVDQSCYKHDLAYKNKDTRHRQKADIDLIHDLSGIKKPTLKERAARAIIKNAIKGKIAVGGTILLSRPNNNC